MKKSYLTLAAAALAFAACTNEVLIDEPIADDVLIGFETFTDNATKATATGAMANPSDFTDAHGGFGVWGYKYETALGSNVPTDLTATTTYTPVFSNVKVWYESTTTGGHNHFTYTVPKYWDKNMNYVFFAYAPYDGTNASITKKGEISIKDISSIQNVSTSTGSGESLVYSGLTETSVTDYLVATYVKDQKINGTNQSSSTITDYNDKTQTVGFTFGHMLSKLQVNVLALEAYKGVKSIKVSYVGIENIPSVSTDKTVFTQTAPTAPAGTYNPASYTSELQIVNSGTGNTNATSQADVYILKNGSINTATSVITDPTAQTQSFNYYVAPNDPAGNTADANKKYLLNVKYTVEYVDGITEDVKVENIDIAEKLVKLEQNYSYVLNVKIGLNQILFTVDAVSGWTDADAQNVEVK